MTTHDGMPTAEGGPGRTAASAGSAPSGTTPSGARRIHARWLARIGGAFVCGAAAGPLAAGAADILFPYCGSFWCLFHNLQERVIVITVAVLLCGLVAGLVAPTGVAGWVAMTAGLVVAIVSAASGRQDWSSALPALLFFAVLLSIPYGIIQWVRSALAGREAENPAGKHERTECER